MTQKNKYYDFNHIASIVDIACDNIELVLNHLNLELKFNGNIYVGKCPIHDGDNSSAFNLYPNGDIIRGTWKCRTHNCHKQSGNSLISLIKTILNVSWEESVDWLCSLLKIDNNNVKVVQIDKSKLDIINSNKIHSNKIISTNTGKLKKQDVKTLLESIPSSYMQSRGFNSSILTAFDVGDCTNKYKRMYNRAVFPVYDNANQYMIGCMGRSIYNQCDICKLYHSKQSKCPINEYDKFRSVKWLASKNFNPKYYLYNYWNLKSRGIEKFNHTAILVEGCGDVLRMEEANIKNSLGSFGTDLTEMQAMQLECLGVMNLIILADNDINGAGLLSATAIKNTYNRVFNIKIIVPENKDPGECSVQYLQDIFKEFI